MLDAPAGGGGAGQDMGDDKTKTPTYCKCWSGLNLPKYVIFKLPTEPFHKISGDNTIYPYSEIMSTDQNTDNFHNYLPYLEPFFLCYHLTQIKGLKTQSQSIIKSLIP